MKKVVITGIAGFIGFHLAKKWYPEYVIYGIDIVNINQDDIRSKRLRALTNDLEYFQVDIKDVKTLRKVLKKVKPDFIVHLAACTGISQSTISPDLYFDTNVKGFQNLLQITHELGIKKILYASSSSVYNPNINIQFEENNNTNSPLSFYGVTKKMNELLAESYSKTFGINCIGMRFFTVYGSWVRPDMAAWKFMEGISKQEYIKLYNNGEVFRDFTHISDIVNGISLLERNTIKGHQIFNIGNNSPIKVKDYLMIIADKMKMKSKIKNQQLPNNELLYTCADITKITKKTGWKPKVSIDDGVAEMTEWFKQYYEF